MKTRLPPASFAIWLLWLAFGASRGEGQGNAPEWERYDANGAKAWFALGERLDKEKFIWPEELTAYGGGGDAPLEKVRTALEQVAPILEEAERAARCTRCEWKYEILGPQTLLPHIAATRATCRAWAARLRLSVVDGHLEEAVRDFRLIHKLARDILRDLPLVSKMVGIACVNVADAAFRLALAECELNDGQWDAIRRDLKQWQGELPLAAEAIAAEEGFAHGYIDVALEAGIERVFSDMGMPNARFPRAVAALDTDKEVTRTVMRARMRELFAELLEIVRKPLHEEGPTELQDHFRRVWEGAKERLARIEQGGDPGEAAAVLTECLFVLGASVGRPVTESFAKLKLHFALFLLWCDLERQRRKDGKCPASLEEHLGSAVPLDDFDGTPVKYALHGSGNKAAFLLGSAGPKKDWAERESFHQSGGAATAKDWKERFPDSFAVTFWSSAAK